MARRDGVWVMDRGVPTEAVLAEMRTSDPPVAVSGRDAEGTPEPTGEALLEKPWQDAREGVKVKLLAEDGELYVFAQSDDRVSKRTRDAAAAVEMAVEAAPANRHHGNLARRVADETRRCALQGAGRMASGRCRDRQGAPELHLRAQSQETANGQASRGRYLCAPISPRTIPRSSGNTTRSFVAVEEAFRNLKGDLAIRPVFHQDEKRIEAHIFIAFLAYCMQITLTRRLHAWRLG